VTSPHTHWIGLISRATRAPTRNHHERR
jgi:hypothetical protein